MLANSRLSQYLANEHSINTGIIILIITICVNHDKINIFMNHGLVGLLSLLNKRPWIFDIKCNLSDKINVLKIEQY